MNWKFVFTYKIKTERVKHQSKESDWRVKEIEQDRKRCVKSETEYVRCGNILMISDSDILHQLCR